jgi:hypothetical protein
LSTVSTVLAPDVSTFVIVPIKELSECKYTFDPGFKSRGLVLRVIAVGDTAATLSTV